MHRGDEVHSGRNVVVLNKNRVPGADQNFGDLLRHSRTCPASADEEVYCTEISRIPEHCEPSLLLFALSDNNVFECLM